MAFHSLYHAKWGEISKTNKVSEIFHLMAPINLPCVLFQPFGHGVMRRHRKFERKHKSSQTWAGKRSQEPKILHNRHSDCIYIDPMTFVPVHTLFF